MGLIRGEWIFTTSTPPGLKEIAEALVARTGLEVRCDSDADPCWLDIPLLKQRLFDLDHFPDRVVVHSFIPAHPYLWAQLGKVMIGFGATASSDPCAREPDSQSAGLDQPWAKLTK